MREGSADKHAWVVRDPLWPQDYWVTIAKTETAALILGVHRRACG
jgi:hypothetical protein